MCDDGTGVITQHGGGGECDVREKWKKVVVCLSEEGCGPKKKEQATKKLFFSFWWVEKSVHPHSEVTGEGDDRVAHAKR